jgi:hypothetical protein
MDLPPSAGADIVLSTPWITASAWLSKAVSLDSACTIPFSLIERVSEATVQKTSEESRLILDSAKAFVHHVDCEVPNGIFYAAFWVTQIGCRPIQNIVNVKERGFFVVCI